MGITKLKSLCTRKENTNKRKDCLLNEDICKQLSNKVLIYKIYKNPFNSTSKKQTLPTPVFWPGEFHGLCSAWGCKESDTTK